MMFIPFRFSFLRRIDLLSGSVQSVSHRSVAQIADGGDGGSLLFARGLIVSSVLDLMNFNIAVTLRQCACIIRVFTSGIVRDRMARGLALEMYVHKTC